MKKIEINFEDIISLEIRLENDKSQMIVLLNKEYKKYIDDKSYMINNGINNINSNNQSANNQMCNNSVSNIQKNKGWTLVENVSNLFVHENIKESDVRKFIAEFRKDKLTKYKGGKMSHLDRMKQCEQLNVVIKGMQQENNEINNSLDMQSQSNTQED